MDRPGRIYSNAARWARICGFQAFLRGFWLAVLARLGFVWGFFANDRTPASNRAQASGCNSISAAPVLFFLVGLAMARTSKRKSTSRKLPGGNERKAVKAHVRRTGEVIWAWNSLQHAFAFAFTHAFPEQSGLLSHALWNAVVSDAAQRDMLKAAIEWGAIPGRSAPALLWALRQVSDLNPYRNDIVHGVTGYRLSGHRLETRFAHFGNPTNRVLRYAARETADGEILEGPNLHKLMALLRGDLLQLAEYVSGVSRSLGTKPPSWPRRPLLQAHSWFLRMHGNFGPRRRHRSHRSQPKSSGS